MYLGNPEGKRRHRSSPVRVAILLILIGFSLYLYAMIRQERVDRPFTPTPTPTRSALSYAADAEELYLQGSLPAAIDAYKQAIALEPSNVALYIPMVRLLTLERRSLEAVRAGRKIVEMAPQEARTWAALCMALDWGGSVAEAIEAGRRAIELDPTYAEGYAYLAEAYIDATRWTEATEAAETALRLNERSVDVLRNYGYVLESQGNWSGAAEYYDKALQIHPNLAYIHVAVGRNHLVLGDLDAALASFQRAVEIDPRDAVANDLLGWTYYGLGEYEQAEAYLTTATEADPTRGQAFGHLAINYWTRRNYEAAIPNFERAIKLEAVAARQESQAFSVTIEKQGGAFDFSSADVVLRGAFGPASEGDHDTLVAPLASVDASGSRASTGGTVTLDTRTGTYTVELADMPRLSQDRVYVGWFEGLKTLAGAPLNTGPLAVRADGSAENQLEAVWVQASPIEYYYTLGLAYFYLDQCERAYPLFNAALQIDPEEQNALEGIRLCQASEEG